MKMRSKTFTKRKAKGFTLFEVLVAMLVIATGLLGLAKMQALAISTTQNAGSRSLIAVQMESLASMMHANPGFWRSGQISSFTASGTTVTDSTSLLNTAVSGNCSTKCTTTQMAANDVQTWVNDMNKQFPTYNAKVTCSTDLTKPIDCFISVTWTEKTVALNKTTATGNSQQVTTQSFSVYLKP